MDVLDTPLGQERLGLLSPTQLAALDPPPAEEAPFRELSPLPDVTAVIGDADSNPAASMLDEIGKALRTGLGVGALAILPDLIADLRRAKDPDTRLKFLSLAFKEGGYGLKEDKTASMPVFHFNFVGGASQVTVEQDKNAGAVDATYVTKAASDAFNDDFEVFTPEALLPESVFDLIEGI